MTYLNSLLASGCLSLAANHFGFTARYTSLATGNWLLASGKYLNPGQKNDGFRTLRLASCQRPETRSQQPVTSCQQPGASYGE